MKNTGDAFNNKREMIVKEQARIHATWVRPETKVGVALEALLQQPLAREYRLVELLRRPELNVSRFDGY